MKIFKTWLGRQPFWGKHFGSPGAMGYITPRWIILLMHEAKLMKNPELYATPRVIAKWTIPASIARLFTSLYIKSTGYGTKGLLFSLLLLFFVPACTLSRPPVYIPPEYRSPPARYSTSREAAPPPARQEAPQQGALIDRHAGFKKQDLPTGPAAQPQAQQPHQQPGQAVPKKPEAQSPQLLASMQLVNEARGPLNRGKPDLAIPVLERAIQVDVQNPEAFMLLARAWRQKGARSKAIEFAKKAEILYQDEPARLKEVFQLEADLYKEMGDSAKASQYRQKAAALR
jgi:hypothetical protein